MQNEVRSDNCRHREEFSLHPPILNLLQVASSNNSSSDASNCFQSKRTLAELTS